MNWLEIAGTIVGLIYLVLEYRANKLLWIAGVIMPAIYVFVYYDAGLYADFGINIYYLLIAVYGYLAWTFGKRTDNGKQTELPITRLPRRSLVASLVISLALFFLCIHTDYIHRQQCALARFVYHSCQCSGLVDACS